jgi:hypothetical protein
VFGELVETCQQPKKATKGPKGQKDFYSFADALYGHSNSGGPDGSET